MVSSIKRKYITPQGSEAGVECPPRADTDTGLSDFPGSGGTTSACGDTDSDFEPAKKKTRVTGTKQHILSVDGRVGARDIISRPPERASVAPVASTSRPASVTASDTSKTNSDAATPHAPQPHSPAANVSTSAWWVQPRPNRTPSAALAALMEEAFGPGSAARGEGAKPRRGAGAGGQGSREQAKGKGKAKGGRGRGRGRGTEMGIMGTGVKGVGRESASDSNGGGVSEGGSESRFDVQGGMDVDAQPEDVSLTDDASTSAASTHGGTKAHIVEAETNSDSDSAVAARWIEMQARVRGKRPLGR
ncbi:hypothetical protein B0H15DRAFT_303744 [Mycena belliarum]|uniref:Uncharacterized protein n=1 Tax=Mycena belliarum TaxID=1033014 RepID=A0AAD6U1Q6_9AGAR|nr:hypothetical protein B0H15DRAFT_303744 [Mycena belliae]